MTAARAVPAYRRIPIPARRLDPVGRSEYFSCISKIPFPTMEAAEQAANPNQVSYRCSFCGDFWHHTTKRRLP